MRIIVVAVAACLLCLAVSVAHGGALYLTDGTKVEGDLKKTRDGWAVTDAKGNVTLIAAEKISSIELKGGGGGSATKPGAGGAGANGRSATKPGLNGLGGGAESTGSATKLSAGSAGSATKPADAAERMLYSLRRSVENIDDVGEIVTRYKRFVEQNRTTETGKAAEAELAVWLDRQSRGLVKVGTQWITPEEKAALLEQTVAVVSEARQLIKDGRLKEADALLVKAMQVDPRNASVQYLRGLLKFNQNDVPAARRAFELAAEQIANHAPTLNNLAVILARQRQEAASLGMYDRAMQAEPLNRVILDNFAEAYNATTNEQRKAPIVQRALKRFMEQDEQLRAQMEPKGLFRWGSTWVNQQQKEANEAAEAKIRAQLDQLASDFDAAQARINTIDEDIESNNRTLRALDSRRYGRDASGAIVTAEPSERMYEIQADNQQLAQERARHVAKLKQLRAAAREAEKQVPTPRYAGVQKLIETEGTPISLPHGAATTQPAPGAVIEDPAPTSAPSTREAR